MFELGWLCFVIIPFAGGASNILLTLFWTPYWYVSHLFWATIHIVSYAVNFSMKTIFNCKFEIRGIIHVFYLDPIMKEKYGLQGIGVFYRQVFIFLSVAYQLLFVPARGTTFICYHQFFLLHSQTLFDASLFDLRFNYINKKSVKKLS